MRELETILSNYVDLKVKNIKCVLATVVHVEGSSYRRAGARMLVDEYGNITGAISGGCLEGDALRKALFALEKHENRLITYDTSDEDDAVIGAQLGCNGVIQVLFEPVDYRNNNVCELLKIVVDSQVPSVVTIGFNLDTTQSQMGTVMVAQGQDMMVHGQWEKETLNVLTTKSREVLQNEKSVFLETNAVGGTAHFFMEFHPAPVQLVLVGAGNDAQILAQQAELLGWKVIVTDGRPTHANKSRFIGACQVVVTKPEETLENVRLDERTCFVLMSHNYNYDLAVLKLLLGRSVLPYIGILGPYKKYERMLNELADESIEVNQEDLKKIHAPIGLEIGAETPAEIGLSILAEIQSVLTKKTPLPLKQKKSPIHDHREFQFQKISI
jgi:hypothetical protein